MLVSLMKVGPRAGEIAYIEANISNDKQSNVHSRQHREKCEHSRDRRGRKDSRRLILIRQASTSRMGAVGHDSVSRGHSYHRGIIEKAVLKTGHKVGEDGHRSSL